MKDTQKIFKMIEKEKNKIDTMLTDNIKYHVFYDQNCGFCHFIIQILKKMDKYSCLGWDDCLREGFKPKNLDLHLETTIVVWNANTNKIWTRHRGFERIISVLPFGFLYSWILLIPGLEKLFGYIYDWISKNRFSISKILGFSACGIIQNKYKK